MSETNLRLSTDGLVAVLTLARPNKRNALTQNFLRELLASVQQVAADDTVRVLVLEAEGSVFCAGMDLGEMEERAASPNASELWAEDTRIYRELTETLFRMPKPTVAVLRGPVLAGGVGIVLACDMVLGNQENAWFALPEPKRGITAAVVTPLLVYRIGIGAAGYLLLSGERLTAAEAFRVGLIHVTASAETIDARRDELVASILTGAPSALAMSKQTLQNITAATLSDQLDLAMQVSAEARETDAAREGLKAFLEKRDPSWVIK